MDIQARLDQWLETNPEAQKYITALYYVPEGESVPDEATHAVTLVSTASFERHITIGFTAKPEYAAFIDMILAMIATNPQ